MNKLILIGNLTRDPEMRTTPNGVAVCNFTIAVNRRGRAGQEQETDFFRVTAWRQLGENCSKFLAKGRKVFVSGPVSVTTYQTQDGNTRTQLEVTAEDVEFLTPKGEAGTSPTATVPQGYTEIDNSELPF